MGEITSGGIRANLQVSYSVDVTGDDPWFVTNTGFRRDREKQFVVTKVGRGFVLDKGAAKPGGYAVRGRLVKKDGTPGAVEKLLYRVHASEEPRLAQVLVDLQAEADRQVAEFFAEQGKV